MASLSPRERRDVARYAAAARRNEEPTGPSELDTRVPPAEAERLRAEQEHLDTALQAADSAAERDRLRRQYYETHNLHVDDDGRVYEAAYVDQPRSNLIDDLTPAGSVLELSRTELIPDPENGPPVPVELVDGRSDDGSRIRARSVESPLAASGGSSAGQEVFSEQVHTSADGIITRISTSSETSTGTTTSTEQSDQVFTTDGRLDSTTERTVTNDPSTDSQSDITLDTSFNPDGSMRESVQTASTTSPEQDVEQTTTTQFQNGVPSSSTAVADIVQHPQESGPDGEPVPGQHTTSTEETTFDSSGRPIRHIADTTVDTDPIEGEDQPATTTTTSHSETYNSGMPLATNEGGLVDDPDHTIGTVEVQTEYDNDEEALADGHTAHVRELMSGEIVNGAVEWQTMDRLVRAEGNDDDWTEVENRFQLNADGSMKVDEDDNPIDVETLHEESHLDWHEDLYNTFTEHIRPWTQVIGIATAIVGGALTLTGVGSPVGGILIGVGVGMAAVDTAAEGYALATNRPEASWTNFGLAASGMIPMAGLGAARGAASLTARAAAAGLTASRGASVLATAGRGVQLAGYAADVAGVAVTGRAAYDSVRNGTFDWRMAGQLVATGIGVGVGVQAQRGALPGARPAAGDPPVTDGVTPELANWRDSHLGTTDADAFGPGYANEFQPVDGLPLGVRLDSDASSWVAPADRVVGSESYESLISDAQAQGANITPDNVVRIGRAADGQVVYLESGGTNPRTGRAAGLEHVNEHWSEFDAIGLTPREYPDFVMRAATEGRVVGHQGSGTGRPIYEFDWNGEPHRVAVTRSPEGFIVGANYRGRGARGSSTFAIAPDGAIPRAGRPTPRPPIPGDGATTAPGGIVILTNGASATLDGGIAVRGTTPLRDPLGREMTMEIAGVNEQNELLIGGRNTAGQMFMENVSIGRDLLAHNPHLLDGQTISLPEGRGRGVVEAPAETVMAAEDPTLVAVRDTDSGAVSVLHMSDVLDANPDVIPRRLDADPTPSPEPTKSRGVADPSEPMHRVGDHIVDPQTIRPPRSGDAIGARPDVVATHGEYLAGTTVTNPATGEVLTVTRVRTDASGEVVVDATGSPLRKRIPIEQLAQANPDVFAGGPMPTDIASLQNLVSTRELSVRRSSGEVEAGWSVVHPSFDGTSVFVTRPSEMTIPLESVRTFTGGEALSPGNAIARRQLADPSFDARGALRDLVLDDPRPLFQLPLRSRAEVSSPRFGATESAAISDGWQAVGGVIPGDEPRVQLRRLADDGSLQTRIVPLDEVIDLNRSRIDGTDFASSHIDVFRGGTGRQHRIGMMDDALASGTLAERDVVALANVEAALDYLYGRHGHRLAGTGRAGDRGTIRVVLDSDATPTASFSPEGILDLAPASRGAGFSPSAIMHELTHGVLVDAQRARSGSSVESGAVSEAFADIGAAGYTRSWSIGDGVVDVPGAGFRNPATGLGVVDGVRGWHALQDGAGTNGSPAEAGVHELSGVLTRPAHRIQQSIGWQAFEDLFFNVAGNRRLRGNLDFATVAEATRAEAVRLWGADHPHTRAVESAFAEFGLDPAPPAPRGALTSRIRSNGEIETGLIVTAHNPDGTSTLVRGGDGERPASILTVPTSSLIRELD